MFRDDPIMMLRVFAPSFVLEKIINNIQAGCTVVQMKVTMERHEQRECVCFLLLIDTAVINWC